MQVAIVHDYLHQFGGAEKVVETWLEMYPDATVYTLVFIPEKFISSSAITRAYREGRIRTTWVQSWLPRVSKYFKHFFWLYPLVMSGVEVSGYDTVLISSTYCAKNVRLSENHHVIHYCHSPTRFLHNLVTGTDHQSLSLGYRVLIPLLTPLLRWLDLRAVTHLRSHDTVWVANSRYIQGVLRDVYKVESSVVYPPISLDKFTGISRHPYVGTDSYYLCHGRISFHKRLDLAIEACLRTGRRLKISGTSALPAEEEALRKLVRAYEQAHPEAQGLVEFLGRTSDAQVEKLIKHARGFIFPGKEDFGIAPLEMIAGGLGIIAYQAGGALEYVQPGINGVFFSEQNIASLTAALDEFEALSLNVPTLRATTRRFGTAEFVEKFLILISKNDV